MALTVRQKRARNAVYQARRRAKRDALVKANPEVAERALLQAADRCCELSEAERVALADRLADAAMGHLRRAQELARVAQRVRLGEDVGER
jgi:adenine C2-methylase RlmN of 23S rRNA A2503 and tRNA A37